MTQQMRHQAKVSGKIVAIYLNEKVNLNLIRASNFCFLQYLLAPFFAFCRFFLKNQNFLFGEIFPGIAWEAFFRI